MTTACTFVCLCGLLFRLFWTETVTGNLKCQGRSFRLQDCNDSGDMGIGLCFRSCFRSCFARARFDSYPEVFGTDDGDNEICDCNSFLRSSAVHSS